MIQTNNILFRCFPKCRHEEPVKWLSDVIKFTRITKTYERHCNILKCDICGNMIIRKDGGKDE